MHRFMATPTTRDDTHLATYGSTSTYDDLVLVIHTQKFRVQCFHARESILHYIFYPVNKLLHFWSPSAIIDTTAPTGSSLRESRQGCSQVLLGCSTADSETPPSSA